MSGISLSLLELLIKGLPEGLLTILALHYFTETKIDPNKYFLLSFSYIAIIYLIRLLPINLGVNTMLSMLALILLFQAVYKAQLKKVARSVAAAVIIVILIMISEILNITLLEVLFGEEATVGFLRSDNTLVKSISTTPSTIFTAVFIFAGRFILIRTEKRKLKHGKAGAKTGT